MMILFKDIDEFRKQESIIHCSLFIEDINNSIDAVGKIIKYIDPKKFFKSPISIDDPLPPRLSDDDYKYIKQAGKRVNNVVKELDSLRRESPLKRGPRMIGLISLCECAIESFVTKDFAPRISLLMYQNISKMKDACPVEIHRQMFEHSPRSAHPYKIDAWPKFQSESVERFVKNYQDVSDVVENFGRNHEDMCKVRPYNVDIDGASFSNSDLDYIFVGWYDLIKPEFKTSKAVAEYEKFLASLPLRKLDLCYVLCYFHNLPVDSLMEKSEEYLLEDFWSNVDDIKKKLLRQNSVYTPTHVINVIWSMFASDKKEEG